MTYVRALACLCLGGLAMAGPAHADLTSDLTADITSSASAVPGAIVTVGAPSADEAAVSPDTNVQVSMTIPSSPTLANLLTPLGAVPFFTRNQGRLLIWDLAVIEAVKHAEQGGATVGSIAFERNYPGVPPETSPELIIAPPENMSQPAAPAVPLTDDEVRQRIQASLPAWAGSATVTVVDDWAGERVVSLQLALAPVAFRAIEVGSITSLLLDQQRVLTAQGANIGRVTAEIFDPGTGDPLYTGGGDGFVGFRAAWYSPLVEGFDVDITNSDVTKATDGVSSLVQP